MIQDHLTFSITALNIKRGTIGNNGRMVWKSNGREIGSLGFAYDTTFAPYVCLSYSYKGKPVDEQIKLKWQPSNINSDMGYYYFICPVTQIPCRKLYLVDGRFMCRAAFRPLYPQQIMSHKERRNPFRNLMHDLKQIDDILTARFRREYYKGKLTPWGRHILKMKERVDGYTAMC